MARRPWDTGAFTRPNGRFMAGRQGSKAFVPGAPPATWAARGASLALYGRAERAIGGLGAVMNTTSAPDFLAALYIKNEAVQSSRIEGTLASLEDLLQYEASRHVGAEEARRLGIMEVANCARAMEAAVKKIAGGGDIDMDLIKSAHRALLHGVRGQEKHPGTIRKRQNAIGDERGEIVHVPPPPEMVERLLEELLSFVAAGDAGMPVLVRCAIAHYQFEAIHPFGDGNGRVGRMLVPLMLAKGGLLPHPLLQLGEYLSANRAEYYARLAGVSQRSEWDAWIMLFLRAFAEQAEATTRGILALVGLRRRYAMGVPGAGRSVASRIVELLFANPYMTAGRASARLGVSHGGAMRGIRLLEGAGVLERVGGPRRTRVWEATEITRIMRGVAARGAGV